MASLQPWVLYALGAAVFAALTTLFVKLGVQNVNADLATAIRTIVVLVIAWALVFARGVSGDVSRVSGRTLLFLVLSGAATGASWVCYNRALQTGPAGPVAAIDKLSLVLVVVLAALFLGETPSWRMLAGVGLITLGTLVLIR